MPYSTSILKFSQAETGVPASSIIVDAIPQSLQLQSQGLLASLDLSGECAKSCARRSVCSVIRAAVYLAYPFMLE
jgi:hypothetical protein